MLNVYFRINNSISNTVDLSAFKIYTFSYYYCSKSLSRNGLLPYTSSRFTGSTEEYAKYVTCNSIPLAKQKLFLLEKTTPITYCILYFLTDSLSLHTAQIMWQSNMLTLYIRTFWCDYCIVLAIM